jgi:phosphoribosylformylglycinamidine cyclo-ligase
MHRSFNCGIGMVVIAAAEESERLIGNLVASGETATRIGSVVETAGPRVEIV